MSVLLSEDQIARISPNFALSHGVARVDDRRAYATLSHVIKQGLLKTRYSFRLWWA